MNVYLYVFSKKVNSTARPTGTGASFTVVLKSPSSVISPRIALVWNGSTSPVAYNYAYIADYSRYYFIEEWTYADRQWIAQMRVDVLATYKTEIGASSKYVLRSASDSDGDVVDTKYPTKAGFTRNVISHTIGFGADNMTGRYVVGIVSPGGTYGSLSIFCMDNTEFTSLRNALSPSTYYQNITDVDLQNLAIDIVNPMQYIAWCKYYPIAIATVGLPVQLELGPINTIYATPLTSTKIHVDLGYDLTSHPLASTRGDYLSCEPFAQRFLSWLPVGIIHIPALAAKMGKIRVSWDLDLISGTGDLQITNDPGVGEDTIVLYRTAFQAGTDIPIAQITTGNPLKLVTGGIGLIGAVGSAITGNIGGAISSGVSAISDFISSMVPEVQALKPGGGSLLAEASIDVIEYFANIVDDDNTENGRPLCKVKTLNTLSGFILCADGSVEAPASASELQELERYLTGGFFYE